jgi:hypothetical protein
LDGACRSHPRSGETFAIENKGYQTGNGRRDPINLPVFNQVFSHLDRLLLVRLQKLSRAVVRIALCLTFLPFQPLL